MPDYNKLKSEQQLKKLVLNFQVFRYKTGWGVCWKEKSPRTFADFISQARRLILMSAEGFLQAEWGGQLSMQEEEEEVSAAEEANREGGGI